ncbi:DUF2924 domain-containing protein [Limnohabitans sp. MMS-10A-160]|uniref:DUF2924 domain-containing protein n=1 Tax=Limnohabitans sp. MMS-10A-160 TaxID=1835766 RepID=UPI001E2FB512|nr:DUF2924 domain-containing protein [Limnohabitans sp. MMS-10A-160]
MREIWALWDEHFDERPQHHHRTWLESRLAYKIQEKAFGSLKPTTRRKLEEIGETGLLPKRMQGDADRLLPGTMLMLAPQRRSRSTRRAGGGVHATHRGCVETTLPG